MLCSASCGILSLKKKPFLASPNEIIEAVSQKLKLKIASVKRDTNDPKRTEMPRRQKKDIPRIFFFRPAPLWLSPGRRTLLC